jgi:hypothetical protein
MRLRYGCVLCGRDIKGAGLLVGNIWKCMCKRLEVGEARYVQGTTGNIKH